MIDAFALLVPHVLLALAVWRLLLRDDVDVDPADPPPHRVVEKTVKKHRRHG